MDPDKRFDKFVELWLWSGLENVGGMVWYGVWGIRMGYGMWCLLENGLWGDVICYILHVACIDDTYLLTQRMQNQITAQLEFPFYATSMYRLYSSSPPSPSPPNLPMINNTPIYPIPIRRLILKKQMIHSNEKINPWDPRSKQTNFPY